MPLIYRKRVMACQHETTIGTAETLTAADGVYNAYDVTIQPEFVIHERMAQGSYSMLSHSIGQQIGVATFKTELWSGGDSNPTWAQTLLNACGFKEATTVWSPTTTSPLAFDTNIATTIAAGSSTLTLGVFEDGLFKSIAGAMGDVRFVFTSGAPVVAEWTFRGVWQAVVDATLIAPTYPTDLSVQWRNTTMTFGGATVACPDNLEINVGNEVFVRPCPTTSQAVVASHINGRKVTGQYDSESYTEAAGAIDDYDLFLTQGMELPLSVTAENGTGKITWAMPKAQRTNVQEGDRSGIQQDTVSFNANRSADAGDDELTITFDAV